MDADSLSSIKNQTVFVKNQSIGNDRIMIILNKIRLDGSMIK